MLRFTVCPAASYDSQPQAISVLGVPIHTTSFEDACDRIQTWTESKASCYIVAANVHVVMTAYWQPKYRQILHGAALVTSDGMPLVWALRLLGANRQTRVYGPDLMLAWCDRAARLSLPIYLYGAAEPILQKLTHNLKQSFPGLTIAGSHAPPFRPSTSAEERADIERIHLSGASVVFVGLGCPKQEEWMARQQGKLKAVMIGVGAAFNFHSGEVAQAPRWLMKLGLEWLYRLCKEPRRLWRRYLINNPAFLALFGVQLIRHKLKRIWSS